MFTQCTQAQRTQQISAHVTSSAPQRSIAEAWSDMMWHGARTHTRAHTHTHTPARAHRYTRSHACSRTCAYGQSPY